MAFREQATVHRIKNDLLYSIREFAMDCFCNIKNAAEEVEVIEQNVILTCDHFIILLSARNFYIFFISF